MPNVVGSIPEFTSDETVDTGTEEVKETSPEEGDEKEKDIPTELPADTTPVVPKDNADTNVLQTQLQGLEAEKQKLLKELVDLRGQRREIKQQEIQKVDSTIAEKLEDLKDVNPEDVTVVERILRSKGYVTKEESNKMLYDAVKTEEINKFLEQYPEYKPENDPNDINWNAVLREMGWYRLPENPRLIGQILERVHKTVTGVKNTGDRGLPEQKQKVQLAGVGSGGAQRSSSRKSLDPDKRSMLLQGGWSEEEIKKMEENL